MLFTDLNQYVVLGALLVIGWLFGYASHTGGKKWRVRYNEESEAYAAYRHDADQQLRDSNARIAELERDHAALAAQQAEAKTVAIDTPAVAEAAIAEPEPVEYVHAEPEPVELVHAEPVAAEPVHAEPVHIEPAHTEPVHAEPVHAQPVAEIHEPVASGPADDVEHTPVAASAAVPAFAAESEPAVPATEEQPKKGWFDHDGRDHLARIRGIDGYMQTKLEALGVSRFEDVEKLSAEDEMALEQRLEVPAGYIAREQWRDQAALLRAGNDAEHSERFAST